MNTDLVLVKIFWNKLSIVVETFLEQMLTAVQTNILKRVSRETLEENGLERRTIVVERNVLYRIAFWFQLLYGNLKIRKFLVIWGSESFGAVSFKKLRKFRFTRWEILVEKLYLANWETSLGKLWYVNVVVQLCWENCVLLLDKFSSFV